MKALRKIDRADGFAARFVPEALSGCWLWWGDTSGKEPYGQYGDKKAHRLSWELHRGSIPDKMDVCHHCDTPLCVNPDHLFVGTRQDNMQDCAKKGRNSHGETRYNARLTADDVVAIRASVEPHHVIAPKFGVDYRTISQIRKRQTWAHVPGERSDDPIANLSHKGEDHPRALLNEENVRAIRARLAAGEKAASLAREFGVVRQMIGHIRHGRAWRHVA